MSTDKCHLSSAPMLEILQSLPKRGLGSVFAFNHKRSPTYADSNSMHLNPLLLEQTHMWQSRVEIKHYSVTYFDCVTAFEVL